MRAAFVRSLLFGALAVLALCTVLTTRCVLEARLELSAGQAAIRHADFPSAVVHLRRAARWDAPFNVYAQRAFDALEQLARAAELRGDRALALSAYRGVHAALHATRGLRISDPQRLQRADARIAALMASEGAPEIDAHKTLAQREEELRALLVVQGPKPLGVLLACGGFFSWVTAFGVLVLRGLDREGRIVRRVARPSFLCLVFGWLAFAVGLQIA